MRLIDADALKNVEIPINGYWDESCQCYVYQPPTWVQLFDAIKSAPTIDAVPVVRCKECIHRPSVSNPNEMGGFKYEFPDWRCPCRCEDGWYSWMPDDNWFCWNGQRKKEDDA